MNTDIRTELEKSLALLDMVDIRGVENAKRVSFIAQTIQRAIMQWPAAKKEAAE